MFTGISYKRTSVIRLYLTDMTRKMYSCLNNISIMKIAIDKSVVTGETSHIPTLNEELQEYNGYWQRQNQLYTGTNYKIVVQSQVVSRRHMNIGTKLNGIFRLCWGWWIRGGGMRLTEYCEHTWNSKEKPKSPITFVFWCCAK